MIINLFKKNVANTINTTLDDDAKLKNLRLIIFIYNI